MAKAVELRLLVIDANDMYNDLQFAVEETLGDADLIAQSEKKREWEFDFDDEAEYNRSCSIDVAVKALDRG